MNEIQEISLNDYLNLKDQSGYYKVTYDINTKYYKNTIHIYYQNKQRHRLDGPAWIDEKRNIRQYYINDKEYTKKEFKQHLKVIQHRIRKFQEYMK